MRFSRQVWPGRRPAFTARKEGSKKDRRRGSIGIREAKRRSGSQTTGSKYKVGHERRLGSFTTGNGDSKEDQVKSSQTAKTVRFRNREGGGGGRGGKRRPDFPVKVMIIGHWGKGVIINKKSVGGWRWGGWWVSREIEKLYRTCSGSGLNKL